MYLHLKEIDCAVHILSKGGQINTTASANITNHPHGGRVGESPGRLSHDSLGFHLINVRIGQ